MRAAVALVFGLALPAQAPAAPRFADLQQPPLGLPPMPLPAGAAAPTAAQFDLGQRLFDDKLLSRDRSVACSSCHLPQHGFSHPDPRPPGIDGRRPQRHAPALWNRGYGSAQRWDGSVPTLEAFVLQPIADPNEMDLPLAEALARLRQHADYPAAFAAAFADGLSEASLAAALATFVRGIVRGDSPYDRFVRGDVAALSPAQRSGLWVFESKGACWKCHTPPLFTDEQLHRTGVGLPPAAAAGAPAADAPAADAPAARPPAATAFKTPTLRGLSLTAPYMHDGSLPTLDAVLDFYVRGGGHQGLDPRLQPLELTAQERSNLLAFLRSL